MGTCFKSKKSAKCFFWTLPAIACAALSIAGPPLTGSPTQWSYEDTTQTAGPDEWGSMPGNSLCTTGTEQTPINIDPSSVKTNAQAPALHFDYQPSQCRLLNNGHTVKALCSPESKLRVDGNTYSLKEFHFHATSEHRIHSTPYPLEIHLVHVDAQGKPAAVVAVLVSEGKADSPLGRLMAALPRKTDSETSAPGIPFNPADLLPKNTAYFHYKGSLTTPPCSEGINWYVLQNPIELQPEQIKFFTSIPGFDRTHRPLQPLGTRKVEEGGQ
jgi:carbonic anhydrase